MTWETILNLIHDEWMILLLLLLWSVAGVTIICERVYALWNVLAKSEAFKNQVIGAIEGGDLPKAHAFCETSNDPLATVFGRGLRVFAKTPQKTTEAVMSQRTVAIGSFKRYLWALGTVGSSAPFVGLFGTVVGILKAFQSMSTAGTGGFKVVSQGIAAALVATATTSSRGWARSRSSTRFSARSFFLCWESTQEPERFPPQWPVRRHRLQKKTPRPRRSHPWG
jgi:biopolymer transport protein ExbB/TolQ